MDREPPTSGRRRRQLYLPRVARVELCLVEDPEDLDQGVEVEDLPTLLHVSFGMRPSDLEGGLWSIG